ncbi:MAG TPA: hypothetical protein VKW06_11855 [Candidatus Angelobacter sp.]|nr:hypothetical protein [Candidatus Angelobacter sp.]
MLTKDKSHKHFLWFAFSVFVLTLAGCGGTLSSPPSSAPKATHTVDLSWTASTATVVGYNIYRGTQSGGPYSRLSPSLQPGTTYSDGSVLSGSTYFYVVTAVDASLQESSFSNEAMAVIPTP